MGIRTLLLRLRTAAVLCVALAVGGRDVGAQSCPPEKDTPRVVVVGSASGGVGQDAADLLAGSAFFPAIRARVPDVDWEVPANLAAIYRVETLIEQVGGTADIASIARVVERLGSPFVLEIGFGRVGTDRRVVTAALFNTHTGAIMFRFQRESRADDEATIGAVEALAQSFDPATLRCELLGARERPAVPQLSLRATPPEGPPGEVVRVRATLTDQSNGLPQEGKSVRIVQKHGRSTRSSQIYTTNNKGEVSADLDVGAEPGTGSIEATYVGSKGRTTLSNPVSVPYRVREAGGDIVIRAPQAALFVGGAATVTATVQRDGAPVQGATTSFTATGGTVGASAVATDAAGNATTPFQAPASNAVVDVTATTPAPPAKGLRAAGADLSATLSFVVDGGVTLSLNAAATVEGGTSAVTADLVLGGNAVPATAVSFTLAGAGALTTSSAATNDAGRAEVIWAAPAGNSSATITAAAVVDGQTYTKSVTVNAGAVGGSVTVKVLPGYYADEVVTGVAAYAAPAFSNCFSTLVVTNACRNSTSADYGGQPADLPVSIRADAGSWWSSLALTQPRPAVVVAEFTGSVGGTNDSISAFVILEMTFDGPGTVDVVVDDPVAAPSGQWSVRRPGDGAATFRGATSSTFVIRKPDRTASIPVTEAGKLEVYVGLSAYTRDDPAFSGTRRMTFTFRPQ